MLYFDVAAYWLRLSARLVLAPAYIRSVAQFNTETFPVSTLSLLVAGVAGRDPFLSPKRFMLVSVSCCFHCAAFAASTLWPLYRSIFEPPAIDTGEVPSNYTTFDGEFRLSSFVSDAWIAV